MNNENNLNRESSWLNKISFGKILVWLIVLAIIVYGVNLLVGTSNSKKTNKKNKLESCGLIVHPTRTCIESIMKMDTKLKNRIIEEKKENLNVTPIQFDIVHENMTGNNTMKYILDSDENGNVFLGFWEDMVKRWTAVPVENRYYIKYNDKYLVLNDNKNALLKDFSDELQEYMIWNLVPFKDKLKQNYDCENDLYFIENNVENNSNVFYHEKTKSYLSVNNNGIVVGIIYPNSDSLLKTEF